ncbi:MAG: hypothetical protein HZC38_10620 [Chloroflexi bacterium]|nr:hypothetical protein [Chloroflexota bacterium]MBI5713856.1 hypothetical protein [Chloroflexota bacterium]
MAHSKTAFTVNKSLANQIDNLARELKVSPKRVLTMAIEDYIKRQQNRYLLKKINHAYVDAPDAEEKKRLRAMRRSHRRLVEGTW